MDPKVKEEIKLELKIESQFEEYVDRIDESNITCKKLIFSNIISVRVVNKITLI